MNIDDQLRRHDPAGHIPEGLGSTPHAIARRDRLTATVPGTEASAITVRSARRKRAVRYSLAAAGTSAVVVLAPILGTSNVAFAGWDTTPRAVTEREAAVHAQTCAAWMTRGSVDGTPTGFQSKIVEARGSWVMAYLASSDKEVQCLLRVEPGVVHTDVNADSVAQEGPVIETPPGDALATTGVVETSAGNGFTQYMVSGKVGAQVTGVVFEAQGTQVRATVKNGVFTAWWPKPKPSTILGRVLDYTGYNASPNPEVKITLSDGTTLTKRIKDYDVNH